MCETLEISRSGYYAWVGRPISVRTARRAELVERIRQAYEESDCTYGSPRVWEELAKNEIDVCVNTVAKLMKQADIRVETGRRFVPQTTDSNHDLPVASNLLEQDFVAERPNQKWVGDITYIQTDQGTLYLAAVMDLYSRKIVGWSMADNMQTQLCLDAIETALKSRQPGPELIHHSDRGSQYASIDYSRLLQSHDIQVSMSRVGNCYDNAVMESFWGTLKTECVYRRHYATHEQARQSIFKYIECWYNRRRRHSTIGYMSPEQFEASLN